MPELPEVETIARVLAQDVAGRSVESVSVLDESAVHPGSDAFRSLVMGRRIDAVRRRAKLALFDLSPRDGDAGAIIAAHLRMTGRLLVLPQGQAPDRPRVVLDLSGGVALAFCDVRRFGSLHAFPAGQGAGGIEGWPFYAGLGPEPLLMTAADFRQRLGRGRARVKALLLDQTVIAGIGNIYADESLFRAGIRPDSPVASLSPERLDSLFASIQAVLVQAIAENGSSIRDYRDAHGDAGAFQNHFRAYGRAGKPCLGCDAPMQATKVAGRGSTFCPHCQK
jgi:formamidopyrimidine-DNA glycosylase